jgi:acyl-coenzyme A thioesterase PaaI-like protein
MPRITAQEVYALCDESLPWADLMGFEIADIGKGSCRVRMPQKAEFLRRPEPVAVIADCHLLKLGKRLAYGEVSLYTEGAEADGPVAHVAATYSIPPERGGAGARNLMH